MTYVPPTREQIYSALFALISTGEGLPGTVTWGAGQTFPFTSRRVRLWDDLPHQPAVCQAEHDEHVSQVTRLPYKRTYTASWLIYHRAGLEYPGSPPGSYSNQILDAIEPLFEPPPTDPAWPDERLTLGGLVHHCFIDGRIFKDAGDIDNQALIVIPITILVP